MPRRKPKLTIEQILAWADHHYKHTGRWPAMQSGPVRATRDESWSGIESSLDVDVVDSKGNMLSNRFTEKRAFSD